MTRFLRLAIVGALLAATVVPATAKTYRDRSVGMSSVSNLDVDRYLGRWYEIARFPNRFEKGCQGVTADYALRSDQKISVTNTCRQGDPNGPAKTANGVAQVEAPGQLSVSFVPWLPFARGDYWVLYVDKAYSVAVVGSPKGSTGWILARTPEISDAVRAEAEAVLRKNGYDATQLLDIQHAP